jgi:hypothetical protein
MGGIHPRGDRKSAQVVDRQRVARWPLWKRVRKKKKAEELDKNKQGWKDKGWSGGDVAENSQFIITWKESMSSYMIE